jgi:hypothetical protein
MDENWVRSSHSFSLYYAIKPSGFGHADKIYGSTHSNGTRQTTVNHLVCDSSWKGLFLLGREKGRKREEKEKSLLQLQYW